ncbi:BatB protein [Chromatiales bacterium (ex Bugula neritina AB1)]|nr:BatB protein [Chromatiales bacterium (ex Bugula neritina AB1)]
MFAFEWWWMVAVLPLPLLIRWLAPAVPARRQVAIRVPFFDDLHHLTADSGPVSGSSLKLLIASLMWIALILAAMRPQWLGEATDTPLSGRDLMLGLDISGSMRERDFQIEGRSVERLDAAKIVASEFIAKREGDRVGLILFGDNAQVQTPLTYDLDTVQHFLSESVVGLIGSSTAIGDSIGLAVKRLRQRPADSRVFILLTDGANTTGAVEPVDAARVAAENGIRIHTIGVGADRVTVRGLFGTEVINPSKSLDEPTLKEIASLTGGEYFRARNTGEMVKIYELINDLETTELDGVQLRPLAELFMWPLAVALGLSALLIWYRSRI